MAANLSLEDVAVALKCNKAQVSRWERGLLAPPDYRILRLVELLCRGDFVIPNVDEKEEEEPVL